MIALPAEVRQYFIEGQYVMRHNPSVWNGIWSEMYIDTTFIRYGHGKGGTIGISLKPETLKTWALKSSYFTSMSHKEEGKRRVLSDKTDREGVRLKLELCIDPLNATQHADGIINIANSHEIDISRTLDYELSPFPTSMFTEEGEMRISKAKSLLRKMLQVSVSTRMIPKQDIIIIDGMALSWVVHWSNQGTVTTLIPNLKHILKCKLESSEVYLIFDWYYDYSAKSPIRGTRPSSASRVYKLTENTLLPPQKVLLTVTENKKQLIGLICEELRSNNEFHKHVVSKFVITGFDNKPFQISAGKVIHDRKDLYTTYE
ncbi:hypothetical protein PR048_016002 [Dryococelus australis]|uniref:Uncharacterized protein n=1 Tax=Dryococelus australis TaxID=614101 RepID=A0ABQ9HII1_9NEOP|nr:hypothetical protein PR048_016002 [Dryococelus australis]